MPGCLVTDGGGQLSWFLIPAILHPGAMSLHPTAPRPHQLSQHLCFSWLAPTTPASWLSQQHTKHMPTSAPLHVFFLKPGALSSQHFLPIFTSKFQLKCHFLREVPPPPTVDTTPRPSHHHHLTLMPVSLFLICLPNWTMSPKTAGSG